MPQTTELRDLSDITTRPSPALCSMAVSARSAVPPESDVTPGRLHLSSHAGDIGTCRPARAVPGIRAMKAAPVGIGDLEPHRRELTGYCQRIVGVSEADDAVQETMLRAWRAELEHRSMQEVARQAIREYVENHSRAELLDQVLDEELPRYAEALERLGQ